MLKTLNDLQDWQLALVMIAVGGPMIIYSSVKDGLYGFGALWAFAFVALFATTANNGLVVSSATSYLLANIIFVTAMFIDGY